MDELKTAAPATSPDRCGPCLLDLDASFANSCFFLRLELFFGQHAVLLQPVESRANSACTSPGVFVRLGRACWRPWPLSSWCLAFSIAVLNWIGPAMALTCSPPTRWPSKFPHRRSRAAAPTLCSASHRSPSPATSSCPDQHALHEITRRSVITYLRLYQSSVSRAASPAAAAAADKPAPPAAPPPEEDQDQRHQHDQRQRQHQLGQYSAQQDQPVAVCHIQNSLVLAQQP